MDKPKTSFVYYKDWAEELMKLPSDLRLRIDDAVKRYVFYGEEPTDREVLYSMFALMRTQIDRDAEKYERIRAVRSDAGNKGNKKRWGDRSQKVANVANVANATNASQKTQKVANVAVDVDADVDISTNVDNKESTNVPKKDELSLNTHSDSRFDLFNKFLERECPSVTRMKKQMTADEFQKLLERFNGNSKVMAECFRKLDNSPKGVKNKSVYRTIIEWDRSGYFDAIRREKGGNA